MIKKEMLKKIFKPIQYGSLTVTSPENEVYEFKGEHKGPHGKLQLNDWKVLDAVAFHHDTGLFETYAEGLWDSDSLETLCDFVFKNEKAFENVDIGIMDGILFWAQSKKVSFSDKKPLSEYQFKFNYKLPKEYKDANVLMLGKNNQHLENLANVTIYKHGVEYQPFDAIVIYDPFFYVKDADVFLYKMHSLLKPNGKMYWRTLVFENALLTQGQFLAKLAFPGYWHPKAQELQQKVNNFFNLESSEYVDYPKLSQDDRLVKIFNAMIIALTQNKKIDYKELILSPK